MLLFSILEAQSKEKYFFDHSPIEYKAIIEEEEKTPVLHAPWPRVKLK